jgi:ribonuclease Z
MDPKNVFWKKEVVIKSTPWTLSGYSRAAYRTGFFVKELNLMFDAGPQSNKLPYDILITHTHSDHICSLPLTLLRENNEDKNVRLYAPIESEHYLDQYVRALYSVNSLRPLNQVASDAYDFIGIESQRTTRRVMMNGTLIELDSCGADHSIPTVVYGISLVKKKLIDKYIGLNSKEIVSLKKTGVEIMCEIVEKKIAYVLDTSIKVFEMNPFLLEYPVIIVECTFILDDEIDNSIKTKHIHWSQLKPYVMANPYIHFILVHFSFRYKDQDIKNFFDREMAESGIQNIEPWLTDLAYDSTKS